MPSQPTKKRSNVRDVARHAKVSVATVSRVLNGARNVSEETKRHVLQAIADLRFVPSSAARSINSGRTRLVGALIPTLDNAIFARFINALEEGLDERGLSLIVAMTNYQTDRELERAKKLLDIGIEGLVVSGITRDPDFDALVQQHQLPVVATSYFSRQYNHPTIGYENHDVGRDALDHLVGLGHSQIAVLFGPKATNDRTRARLEGLKAFDNLDLHYFETELEIDYAAMATKQALASAPQVTAILCLSDVIAQGALLHLGSRNIQVPAEISVVGVDDLPGSSSFDPPLTTMRLPVVEMGAQSARAIANWIEEGQVPSHLKLDTQLILRRSTDQPANR